MRRAAARSAGRDQPSNATSGSIASISAARWLSASGLCITAAPLGEKGGEIDRMALQFLEENQEPVVGHPLRIENAVEMVAFVLHDAGVKAPTSRSITSPSRPSPR